jgi:acyl carrier protein
MEAQRTFSREVIQVVTDLSTELHPVVREYPLFGPQSNLERDLGFDSLARIELSVRLERKFGVRLAYSALERFKTVADVLAAVGAVRNSER